MKIEGVQPTDAQYAFNSTSHQKEPRKEAQKTQVSEADKFEKGDLDFASMLKTVNAAYNPNYHNIKFEKSEYDGYVIQVYDKETDELVRQIPPEELLKLKLQIESYKSGDYFETTA